MAQEEKKVKKEFRSIPGIPSGNDDKPAKKGPKFSIYWIYAIIAVILISANLINMSPDAQRTTEYEFTTEMLAKGDVEKLDEIKNKDLVRVYIKQSSLTKPNISSKIKHPTSGINKGPHFEFTITDWAGFNKDLNDFYKDSLANPAKIKEVAITVTNEGER